MERTNISGIIYKIYRKEVLTENRALRNMSVIPAEIEPTKSVIVCDDGMVATGEFVYTG